MVQELMDGGLNSLYNKHIIYPNFRNIIEGKGYAMGFRWHCYYDSSDWNYQEQGYPEDKKPVVGNYLAMRLEPGGKEVYIPEVDAYINIRVDGLITIKKPPGQESFQCKLWNDIKDA